MEQFQTAYTPLLRYIVAPILTDERDREECLSDVLLRMWDSIGTFDPGWDAPPPRDSALIGDLDATPDGLDTTVGEEGENHSGGQRQQVAMPVR